MRPELGLLTLALCFASIASVACGDDEATSSSSTTSTGTGEGPGGGGVGGGPEARPTSPEPKVRFQSGDRLERHLAKSLELEAGAVCLELGAYDCFPLHQVSLLESDAFGAGLFERLPETTATTPLAVDRVVLAACARRVDADLAGGRPVLFDLPVDDAGRLVRSGAVDVRPFVRALYRRALARDPRSEEVATLASLYPEIEAESDAPARDFAVLACFATFTTMEALFY